LLTDHVELLRAAFRETHQPVGWVTLTLTRPTKSCWRATKSAHALQQRKGRPPI